MSPYEIVRSLAGHDKGKLYLVIGEAEGKLLVADGKSKTLAKPKIKSSKHLRREALNDKAPATDKEIRTTLAEAAKAALKEDKQLGER